MRHHSKNRRVSAATEVPATFWMIAFSDLLTLLITFFVMRLSMKTLDQVSITELFNNKSAPAITQTEVKLNEVTAMLTGELERVLGSPLAEMPDENSLHYINGINIKPWKTGSVIWLSGGSFLPASDELSREAVYGVRALSRILSEQDVQLKIAGHTDNTPINSSRFPSNWELSTSRAIAITKQLIDEGVQGGRISVIGYADKQPKASNRTEEGKHLNRRVEIYVYSGERGKKRLKKKLRLRSKRHSLDLWR